MDNSRNELENKRTLEKLLENNDALDRMANRLMDRYSAEIDAIPISSWDSAREIVQDLIRAGMEYP